MSAPLEVLQVVDGLWVGGTERSLVEMLPRFEAHGIDVRIACLRRREEGVEGEVPPNRLLLVSGEGLAGQARSLRRLLRRDRPALVHSSLFRANMVTRLAAAGTGIPVLNSLVNDSYGPDRLRDPRIRPWRLRAVQLVDAVSGRLLADHFHAVSETVAEAARRRLRVPVRRLTVVRRGRDPHRLGEPSKERRLRARRALGILESAPVVVNVGRQEFQKGQEHLLRAAAGLRARHAGLVVLLAGRAGAATPHLETLAGELDLAATVRFLGHRSDVPEILAAADVFAFPSLYEGLPGAVIEAMALGLPVVAADIGPVREIVEPEASALLVPPGDAEALAAALDTILSDPARAATLGRRGRDRFLEHLTLEGSARAMAALYRNLAAGRDG